MKLFSKFSVLLLGAVLLFGFASCQHETSSAEPTLYSVTVSSSIEHGKVTVDKTSAGAGATITLTATADDDYELDSYSVTDSSANAITVTNGTFTMPESNVTVSATFAPTYSVTITDCANGSVTANKTSAIAGATITLTATADDGYELDSYSVTDSSANAITVTNGTFTMPKSNVTVSAAFKVAYIGTKAPTVAKEVGDIVFNDGSAMPYTAFTALTDAEKDTKKTSAIALIFYNGTGLNSDNAEGNADNTTSRTLGVGLKHNKSGLAWCTNSANACNKNITTIQCPASGNAGALTFTGDKNGSDNLEQIEDFDGVDDTSTVTNYPAFYFAKNYSTHATNLGENYASGWYLPSIAELFQIYANGKGANKAFDLDAASYALGGNKFGDDYYWSSSQYASHPSGAAYMLGFSNGGEIDNTKDGHFTYVCAIRAFN